ncbi:MAG TPA: hypothetical protein VKB96_12480, partial [Gammaproteobacteria bacterium]|nr:hypothetical protein [Gammaproteobacteria bacterium]
MSHLTLPHETAFQRQCLRAILAEYRAQAIDVLRRAGLDPSDSGKLGTAALYEPTNPIGAAWRVLRTVHQVELLITDKNALDAL